MNVDLDKPRCVVARVHALAILLISPLTVACFAGDGLVSQPCERDEDCNPALDLLGRRLRCEQSVCGYSSRCDDGILDIEAGEECDDGNRERNDGCSEHCKIEHCGDGVKQRSEACDDGNLEQGDGCSPNCELETCGDGILQAGEECDDGNDDDNDDCPSTCIKATCGDGHVAPGEECDDGNRENGDNCSEHCLFERCGDGIFQSPEECDDGNEITSDGCVNCKIATCGDGYVHAGVEECDDGDDDNANECVEGCMLAKCGDGFVHEGVEACDDGNSDDEDTCFSSCKENICGDQKIDRVEEACDDGNDDYTDGCHECRALSTSIHGGAAAEHACAARAGSLRCWGSNDAGQLGLGDSAAHGDDEGDLPTAGDVLLGWALDVSGMSPVELGKNHTCAIVYTDNGVRVACWGSNQFLQLGWETGNGFKEIYQGDEPSELPPKLLNFGDEVPVELAAGGSHTCARMESGAVRCWGDHSVGQLGTSETKPDKMLSTDVDIGGKALQLAAGELHTCALYEDAGKVRRVRCWGYNLNPYFLGEDAGQLGLPLDLQAVYKPTNMPPLPLDGTVEQIAAGAAHTCALLDGGTAMRCWGQWKGGALGLGHEEDHGIPLDTQGAVEMLEPGDVVTKMALGYDHTCVLLEGGGVRCWGDAQVVGYGGDEYGLTQVTPPLVELGGDSIDDLVAGFNWTCALIHGEALCWGGNSFGQLGINSTTWIGDDDREMPPTPAMIYKQDAL